MDNKRRKQRALFFWLLRWSIVIGLPAYVGFSMYVEEREFSEIVADANALVESAWLIVANWLGYAWWRTLRPAIIEAFLYLYEYDWDVLEIFRYFVYAAFVFYAIGYIYFFFKYISDILGDPSGEENDLKIFKLVFGACVLGWIIWAFWYLYGGS